MKQLDIGGSGVLGSAIGVGCMRMNCMEPQAILEYIHTALEKGINFFDHADIYGGGECETRFGQALALEPGLRERLVLQTKCGIRPDRYDFSKEHILESVEGSLRRLGTDHVDFLLLHRPDALMEPEEVAEAFHRLESQGKVLHFGVSNFSARQLELLQSGLKQKLRANQMQFGIMCAGMVSHSLEANTHFPNAADRDGEVLDYCRLKGITIQAWSPFQYGFFEGVFIDNEKFPRPQREAPTALGEVRRVQVRLGRGVDPPPPGGHPGHCGHHQGPAPGGHRHRRGHPALPGGLVPTLPGSGQQAAVTKKTGQPPQKRCALLFFTPCPGALPPRQPGCRRRWRRPSPRPRR